MKDKNDPGTIDLEDWLKRNPFEEEFVRSLDHLEGEYDEQHIKNDRPSKAEQGRS